MSTGIARSVKVQGTLLSAGVAMSVKVTFHVTILNYGLSTQIIS